MTTPTDEQYAPIQEVPSGPGPETPTELPFSGFELGAVALIATGFLAAGVALRRLRGS